MKLNETNTTFETTVKDIADYSINQIPVLNEHLKSVMKETEDAALLIGDNLRRISANSNGLSSDREAISNLLVSLQFQDITRQRIEHVINSLTELKTELERLSSKEPGKESRMTEEVRHKEECKKDIDDEQVVLF